MTDSEKAPASTGEKSSRFRLLWMALGWVMVALGAIGVVLPIMPTVPFLLVAVWAFGKGSERWRQWLLSHRVYGPYLHAWYQHGVIPPHAKVLAVLAMSGSAAIMYAMEIPRVAFIAACVVLAAIAVYIVSRPSRPPAMVPTKR